MILKQLFEKSAMLDNITLEDFVGEKGWKKTQSFSESSHKNEPLDVF